MKTFQCSSVPCAPGVELPGHQGHLVGGGGTDGEALPPDLLLGRRSQLPQVAGQLGADARDLEVPLFQERHDLRVLGHPRRARQQGRGARPRPSQALAAPAVQALVEQGAERAFRARRGAEKAQDRILALDARDEEAYGLARVERDEAQRGVEAGV